jgi:5S rRNA maturation endonuclease (ribonuclease M5)
MLSFNNINKLSASAVYDIDNLYKHFGIKYVENEKTIRSCCHIHGGDNFGALNLYHKGNVLHYKCYTHHCEEYFGKSFISMIRGLLSRQRFKWSQPGDNTVSFKEAIEFLKAFAKQELCPQYDSDREMDDFISAMDLFGEETCEEKKCYPSREELRRKLKIPARYFLNRGYSSSVLDEYDVGTCTNYDTEMYNRAVVPIYNRNYLCVGLTGRSVFEMCNICKSYHAPNSQCRMITKWRNSKNFTKRNFLYNLNKAKNFIRQTKVAVIVESPGNVWRLEEAGIHNSVGLFGTFMSDKQVFLLDDLGTMALIIIMDKDGAGKKAEQVLKEKYSGMYNLYFLNISQADVGKMSVKEINTEIKPFLSKIIGIY